MSMPMLKVAALTGAVLLTAPMVLGMAVVIPQKSGSFFEVRHPFDPGTVQKLKGLRDKLENVAVNLESESRREQEQLREIQSELDTLLSGDDQSVYCPAKIRWAIGKC